MSNNILDAEDPEVFKVIKINNKKIEHELLLISSKEGHGYFNPDPGELITIENSKVQVEPLFKYKGKTLIVWGYKQDGLAYEQGKTTICFPLADDPTKLVECPSIYVFDGITLFLKSSNFVANSNHSDAHQQEEIMDTSPGGSIFISYGKEDSESARQLYNDLREAGLDPWLDEEKLLGGQSWRETIIGAIRDSRYFIALLSSKTVNRTGFVQKEISHALDVLEEYPESKIYLIPVRLDMCKPSHNKLSQLQWIDMFPDWEKGFKKLMFTFSGLKKEVTIANKLWDGVVSVRKQLDIFYPPWNRRQSLEASDTWIAIHRLENLLTKMGPFIASDLYESVLKFHDIAHKTFGSMLEWSDIEMNVFGTDGWRKEPLDYKPPERASCEKNMEKGKEQLDLNKNEIMDFIREISSD